MVYVKMVSIEKREDREDEVRKDSQPSSKFESSSLFKKIIVFKSHRKMWFAGASIVCYTAVFSVVTQRSSPRSVA